MDRAIEGMEAPQPETSGVSVLVSGIQFPAADAAVRRRQGERGPKPGEFDWTEERVETLKAMWAAGKSQGENADAINCQSRSAIGGKIHRLGLARHVEKKPKPPRPERPRGRPARTYLPTCKSDAWVSTAALPEGRLLFEDLSADVCHFPVGDTPYRFCAADVQRGPYCPNCKAIAYRT